MIGTIVFILGIFVTSKLTSLLNRTIKAKYPPETIKRYRPWLTLSSLVMLTLGATLSFALAGLANGVGFKFFVALKFASALLLAAGSAVFLWEAIKVFMDRTK